MSSVASRNINYNNISRLAKSTNLKNNKPVSENLIGSDFFAQNKSRNNHVGIVAQLNNKYQNNKTVFIVIGVVALFFVVVGLYYFYHYVKDRNVSIVDIKEVIDSVQDGQEEMEVSAGEIPISKYSNEYGISIWFKIDSYTYKYGHEKVILKRGDGEYGTPEILLAPKDNKLIVRTKLQHPVNELQIDRNESFADVPANNLVDNSTNESFKAYSAGSSQLAPLEDEETQKESLLDLKKSISDNSAPRESKQYDDNYFNMISGNTIEGFENGDNMDVNATSNSIVSGTEPNNEQSEPNATVGTTEDSGAIDSTNPTEAIDTTSVAATAGSSNNKEGEDEGEGEGETVNGNVESGQNNMENKVRTDNTQKLSLASEPIKHYDECIVNNIPLQKWVNLVVSQYNQTMDIYLDGQLVSSCVLKGFPEVREEGVSICPDGGFEGSISRLAFYNTAISHSDAYQIYRAGGNFTDSLLSSTPQWLTTVVIIAVIALLVYALLM